MAAALSGEPGMGAAKLSPSCGRGPGRGPVAAAAPVTLFSQSLQDELALAEEPEVIR